MHTPEWENVGTCHTLTGPHNVGTRTAQNNYVKCKLRGGGELLNSRHFLQEAITNITIHSWEDRLQVGRERRERGVGEREREREREREKEREREREREREEGWGKATKSYEYMVVNVYMHTHTQWSCFLVSHVFQQMVRHAVHMHGSIIIILLLQCTYIIIIYHPLLKIIITYMLI